MNISSLFQKIAMLLFFFCSVSWGREFIPFNEDWHFLKGPFPEKFSPISNDQQPSWSPVKIPHTWNADDMQLNKNNFYTGPAYYKKTYTPDASLKGKRLFLRFEGVASVAEVTVNGELAGNHKGAYSAFALEITDLLKYGEANTILVKADNTARPDVIPINHKLFGVYGGMYRPVQLIITEDLNISVQDYASPGVYLRQQNVTKESADLTVKVKLENKSGRIRTPLLVTTLYEADGKTIKDTQSTRIQMGTMGMELFEQQFKIPNPHLWQGMEDPYLYQVVVQVMEDGKVIDQQIQHLGLRHFELKVNDGMYLNGKKVPMYGVCRHQEWLGLGSALDKEHHDTDLAIMKEMGATTIRFAHYQQSDYLYSQCDKIGFIIWAEIPFVNRVSTQESDNAKQQLTELIRQSYNHPSIYVWGLHNEVYKPHNYTTQLTRELHDLAKTEDPDRYTVSVNGYGQMDHPVNLNADIQGMNRYYGWYERKIHNIEDWFKEIREKFPHNKAMLAEYGAEANIDQHDENVADVGNFFSDFYPEEFATRFHEIQWGFISRQNYLLASYLWNTFDFATPETTQGGVNSRNMKGLVTFDRKIKKDVFYWYKANWSKEPVLYITQRRAQERTHKTTPVTVYSNTGAPELYVNGQKIEKFVQGTTPVHYIFEDITLREGENILIAKAGKDGKILEDKITWNYDKANEGKKTRGKNQIDRSKKDGGKVEVNEKEHSGL